MTAIASLAIAQSASARFVIFVAGNDFATLQKVRAISPSAFATKINDQPVIQAGIFNSETSADSLAIALQQSGLSAQKYFRASGGKESNVQIPFSETTTSPVVSLPNPQNVLIQPNQPTNAQVETQASQVFNSVPVQMIANSPQYQPQYQQITTNTVVPQVQTQQVLVSRWQQVLVPETRQIVTQAVVPQTQLVQVPQTQFVSQPVQTSCVQPVQTQISCVQPTQATAYTQTISYAQQPYMQSQTGFVTAESLPVNYDSSVGTTSIQSPPASVVSSNNQTLPQATQNPNFRYVAAIPAAASNQFLLSKVRQYVPTAFFANSGRGNYINAGSYQNRDSAEAVSRYLRSQGVDSRVLYF